jgi:hypothetical protein
VNNWATIASLATAGGTLVLAVATFAAVRSGNRSARTADRAARIAEESLLAGQRPLLVNSRLQDAPQKARFVEGNWVTVQGGGATLEATDGALYLAISVRNVGTGLAVMLGWHVVVGRQAERSHPPLEDFTIQQRDIYVGPGDSELWQGALRDSADDRFKAVAAAIEAKDILTVSLLYGDYEGGQRMISQFSLQYGNDRWLTVVGRHFNIDRADPR